MTAPCLGPIVVAVLLGAIGYEPLGDGHWAIVYEVGDGAAVRMEERMIVLRYDDDLCLVGYSPRLEPPTPA